MPIRSAAKALMYENGKILLNSHKTESGRIYYDLPGGGQRQYETMEEAVIREVLEETGYTVEVVRFQCIAEEISEDPAMQTQYPEYTHRIMHIFLVLGNSPVFRQFKIATAAIKASFFST